MRFRHLVSFTFCFIFAFSLFCLPARGFIHREFTTHEVLDGSTNIVFAKVKSVDARRLNAVVEAVEDVKGNVICPRLGLMLPPVGMFARVLPKNC